MENLLTATKEKIEKLGYTPADIIFIGSMESGHECDWGTFCALADAEYNSGYGSVYVAKDLVIVFSDGSHLRRREYDGAERWEYIPIFKRPAQRKEIATLFATFDEEEAETVYELAEIHKALGSE